MEIKPNPSDQLSKDLAAFYDQLLTNPREALRSFGVSLTAEESNELVQHLNDKGEITLGQTIYIIHGVLQALGLDVLKNRDVVPPPPPPPPPLCWWPSEQVLEALIQNVKSEIEKWANSKSKPKRKTKTALKRKTKRR